MGKRVRKGGSFRLSPGLGLVPQGAAGTGGPALGPGIHPCASWCCQTAVPGDVIAGREVRSLQPPKPALASHQQQRAHRAGGGGGADWSRSPRDQGRPPAGFSALGKQGAGRFLPHGRVGREERGRLPLPSRTRVNDSICQRTEPPGTHHRPDHNGPLCSGQEEAGGHTRPGDGLNPFPYPFHPRGDDSPDTTLAHSVGSLRASRT